MIKRPKDTYKQFAADAFKLAMILRCVPESLESYSEADLVPLLTQARHEAATLLLALDEAVTFEEAENARVRQRGLPMTAACAGAAGQGTGGRWEEMRRA